MPKTGALGEPVRPRNWQPLKVATNCGTLGGPVCRFIRHATVGSHALDLRLHNDVTHAVQPHLVLSPRGQKLVDCLKVFFVKGNCAECVMETQTGEGQKPRRPHSHHRQFRALAGRPV